MVFSWLEGGTTFANAAIDSIRFRAVFAMFHFAHPWFLLLTLAVPPLAWLWWRQRRQALRYPDTTMLAELPSRRSRYARWGGAGFRALALLLVIIALAGPRFADRNTRIPTKGIAIEVVLDVSGSMAERDFLWDGEPISRLDAAKKAFRLFVAGGEGPEDKRFEGRPNDLVGFVTFATRPESPCPLTLSHSVLLHMLDSEQPQSVPGESETNLSDAVALGLHRLESARTKRKVMVLITDGEHNVVTPQSEWTPRQAAQIAANLGVPIYAIDAGGEGDVDAPAGGGHADPKMRAEIRTSAETTLKNLADISKGRYFQARDTRTLLAVCEEIDRLEKVEIESFQYRRYYECFPWLGLSAFGALTVLQLLEMTIWRRMP